MRRLMMILLLITACRPETPVDSSGTSRQAPVTASSATAPTSQPRPAPVPPVQPTPRRCGGDGSYHAALDCLRVTSGVHFVVDEGSWHAEGDMSRSAVGAERARFSMSGKGRWSAFTKKSGLVWYHDGKRVTDQPPFAETIWQRTTLVPDPQKKEGEARLAPSMADDGDSNEFAFTDANNGDAHRVWVSRKTGDVVRIRIVPAPPFRTAHHELDVRFSGHGSGIQIDEPKQN